MQQFSWFYTLDWFRHVWALPQDRIRRLHVLKDATQLSCIRWSTLRWLLSQLVITPLVSCPDRSWPYKVNMEWKWELCLWTKTILTRGSQFLMAWTSWSQTWSTRSTTTTSTKPPQRRRKHMRLQTESRLKQNREDLQLLAHLQGLYIFLIENGLILNQELNSIKRTQWQKGWTLFFDTENYLEKKMERSNSGD